MLRSSMMDAGWIIMEMSRGKVVRVVSYMASLFRKRTLRQSKLRQNVEGRQESSE